MAIDFMFKKGNGMFLIKVKNVYLFILVTSIIWGQVFKLVNIPGIGTIYLLQLILLFYFIYQCLSLIINRVAIYNNNNLIHQTNMHFILIGVWTIVLFIFCEKTTRSNTSTVLFLMNLLLISCVSSSIQDYNDEQCVLRTMLFNSLLLGVIGMYESFAGRWLFRYDYPTKWNNNSIGTLNPVGVFYNTNNYCMFMVLSLPVFFMTVKNKFLRGCYTVFILFIATITSCRTGYVAVAIFAVIYLSIKVVRLNYLKILLTILVIIFAIGSLAVGTISLSDDRIFVWANTIRSCIKTHFIGVGVGNGPRAIIANAIYNVIGTNETVVIAAPHNYFLELLLETGIIGIAILLHWFIKIIRLIWHYKAEESGMFYFMLLVLLMLTSICVSTMTDFFQYWLVLAMILSFAQRKQNEE